MTRLIDADMFRQEADNEDKNGVLTFHDVALWIEEQPTVDAVPVIRCKDCKYAEYIAPYLYHLKCSELHWNLPRFSFGNSFCSMAERKDDDETN